MDTLRNEAFIAIPNSVAGLVFNEENHPTYPIRYYNIIKGEGAPTFNPEASYYGFIYKDSIVLSTDTRYELYLTEGMFFSLSEPFKIENYCGESGAIIIEVLHTKGLYPATKFKAVFQVGGAIEGEGRLKYIDGCTDSLLIPPVKFGDPCLNHLHFPPNIKQTPHTHPSHRIGIVARGEGECITPFGNIKLTQGMIFIIKEWDGKTMAKGIDGNDYEVGNHCFNTYSSSMDVIAFHPDSDFGATDNEHPMINRTIVNGLSAKEIDAIRTK